MDTSYLADSVVLFRYFEYAGKVKKAISVMKKRSGAHEESIRELRFDTERHSPERAAGTAFRGILTGVPQELESPRHGSHKPLKRTEVMLHAATQSQPNSNAASCSSRRPGGTRKSQRRCWTARTGLRRPARISGSCGAKRRRARARSCCRREKPSTESGSADCSQPWRNSRRGPTLPGDPARQRRRPVAGGHPVISRCAT